MIKAGYNYHSEAGRIRIFKDSLLKMSRTLNNGLYILKGNTAISQPNVTTDVQSKKIVLWHKRLAHVSERGLPELHKQGCFRTSIF